MTIADKNMHLYKLYKKFKIARESGFIFNHINKPAIEISTNLSKKNICFNLKFSLAICNRRFFKTLSQNPENATTHCNNFNNPFHFEIRKLILEIGS